MKILSTEERNKIEKNLNLLELNLSEKKGTQGGDREPTAEELKSMGLMDDAGNLSWKYYMYCW
jgi:hypothetical protein